MDLLPDNNKYNNKIKYIFFLLILVAFSCDKMAEKKKIWEKNCNKEIYHKLKTDTSQRKELLNLVFEFKEVDFEGTVIAENGKLSYKWHKGRLNNEDFILKIMMKYGIYAVEFNNDVVYFVKGVGFKSLSCGILYLPNGKETPRNLRKKKLLLTEKTGEWYYIEG